MNTLATDIIDFKSWIDYGIAIALLIAAVVWLVRENGKKDKQIDDQAQANIVIMKQVIEALQKNSYNMEQAPNQIKMYVEEAIQKHFKS